jgi:glycosyltransferase involved in cell wall biosynthesis
VRLIIDARISRRWDAGVGRYTCSLLDALAGTSHDFIVFTNAASAAPPLEAPDRTQLVTSGVGIASIRQQIDLPLQFRRYRPDVILATHPLAATRFAPCPSVPVVLDLYPLHFPEQFPRAVSYYYAYVFAHIARHKRGLIAISEATKKDVVARLGVPADRISVTPLAASAVFQPVEKAQMSIVLARYGVVPPYVLYHGNKRPHKNVPGLLAAFALCIARHPALQLVITGREDRSDRETDFTAIRQAAQRLGLEDRIIYTGLVPDLDLAALYSAAELTAIPSFLEGFGLPALESMACGTPVVASNAGSLPEVVGDGGLLVNPYDVGDIARGMLSIVADPEAHSRLRTKALAQAEQFSWAKTAQLTLDLLDRVAGSAP